MAGPTAPARWTTSTCCCMPPLNSTHIRRCCSKLGAQESPRSPATLVEHERSLRMVSLVFCFRRAIPPDSRTSADLRLTRTSEGPWEQPRNGGSTQSLGSKEWSTPMWPRGRGLWQRRDTPDRIRYDCVEARGHWHFGVHHKPRPSLATASGPSPRDSGESLGRSGRSASNGGRSRSNGASRPLVASGRRV